KYQDKVSSSKAAAIIVHTSMEETIDKNLLLVENPYLAFAKILTYFEVSERKMEGVLPGANVHPEADIA
ncbi:MAG: UDP-3-O-(3-hydroxymyristoyl)glucosamine N-acyltransferase, partial [Gammaproteobacteria bacterium]|nr:UDP-3-O-(3-hydroxymyristoyl)glucosamine N-acyltransferase [Gammaproteobacteria bacterium]NIW45634.1 UDP-3-O-(3-hydroxymyristoyl)glucosamine N-acyltransferase [Gammaproteobacteria bacterium]NIX56832.1 UDP-3-O-(3-hydroxymyristoyl)glucosamine N-acyltransferase [candidate division Zixibacteria bacterium]